MTFADLLRCDFADLRKQAKGHWLVALRDNSWPATKDKALLIDEDLYADQDTLELESEGQKYIVTLDIAGVEDVVKFHLQTGGADSDQDRLKALLYYIGCDAFFDRSPASEANWAELEKSFQEITE
ncbi:MAG: DUF7716 domain-containing protein [Octadecabacter sp.]